MLDPDARQLLRTALAEDVGSGDVTTAATVPAATRARARIRQKAPGVVFGLELAEAAFRELDPDVRIERQTEEGEWRGSGPVLELEGSARAILTAERTALNFLAHLSGVATLTASCVRELQAAGSATRILDTRKTTPGMRLLEKAAVAAGGGVNHRVGLYDAILIKENHAALAGGVGAAVRAARAAAPDLTLTVECRDAAEVAEALAAEPDRILLDNMAPEQLAEAVRQIGGRAVTEASGGMAPGRLGVYAQSGVDFISMGALTHSAPALDLSLILEPLP